MQGEVHGIALPACATSVPVTACAQHSVSSLDPRVAGFSSVSSLSASGELSVAKLQQPCVSFGRKATHPMAMISSDAVADAAIPTRHGQDSLVLEIGDAFSAFNNAPKSNVPSDGTPNIASAMLVVVGHRGCGKNKILPLGGVSEVSMLSIRENTITSFNLAARNGAQFVEFDVQVTKDGVPIIFHDDMIITEDTLPGKHIGDITLEEFRAMGPQRDSAKVGQALYRRAANGTLNLWMVDVEDSMCTLTEAFHSVEPTIGFNIELKFDDDGSTSDEELHRVIDAVLEDVWQCANERMIYFSSFHPDAVHILRQKMSVYPVFFLTDGGSYLYKDVRRNSIEAAIEVCRKGNLQGIVSEVTTVLHRPASVALVKNEGLFFFTYGELNNVGEAVLKQQSWGIDGVIVDHVLEMVRVARHMHDPDSSPSAALTRNSVSVVSSPCCKYEEMVLRAHKKKKEEQPGKKDWKHSAMKIINRLIFHFLYKL